MVDTSRVTNHYFGRYLRVNAKGANRENTQNGGTEEGAGWRNTNNGNWLGGT